jgi:hypothetical protein
VIDRRSIFAKVLLGVTKGDRALEEHQHGVPAGRDRLREISRELIRLAEDKQPYSRAATCHICRFRDRDWVERMVVPHLRMTP